MRPVLRGESKVESNRDQMDADAQGARRPHEGKVQAQQIPAALVVLGARQHSAGWLRAEQGVDCMPSHTCGEMYSLLLCTFPATPSAETDMHDGRATNAAHFLYSGTAL